MKGDIGFDVNKATSIFFNAGIIGAKWKYTTTTEGKSIGALIGLGAEYSINDNIVITAKYQRASVDFEDESSDIETISNIFGIGVGYKF